MKNKIYLIAVFIFLGFASINSQEVKLTSAENINMLKKGALFVRLKTSDLAINSFKKQGKNKEAEDTRLKQEAENKEIVKAFKNKFKFCPVYFFYSNNSEEIKKRNCKEVLFDINFQKVSLLNCNDFLVGEFDESNTTHLDAFIIKDRNYKQLNGPFPFLIKINTMGVSTKTKEDIVIDLDLKLHDFLTRNQ